jgi:hypothetical protein
VEWVAGSGVAEILVVSFKGRSPFKHTGKERQVLEPGSPGTTGSGTPGSPFGATTAANAQDGTYSYTIVVRAASGAGGAVHAKDPDLDVIG